ncbi:hypothetical protein ACWOC1_09400 [Enterococcus quebecensis]|uniref:Uncharacterized protein n=1 Tax=Enterococcus quebecensis TaxID=903983 RepID=A0A1E5GTP8_9ENTE|nr:hypothetical protein [Enterococcus quebecensis]OEG15670.1 hypothetical protein BCR23_09405 [Enterococcus quebecensis]
MLITLCYAIVGGGLFYLIEGIIVKRKKINLCRFHKVTGYINLCLALGFLLIYFINQDIFSKDVTISNEIIYICFSILAIYYYVLALPIALANSLIIIRIKNKEKRIINLNIISCVLLIISVPLFLK